MSKIVTTSFLVILAFNLLSRQKYALMIKAIDLYSQKPIPNAQALITDGRKLVASRYKRHWRGRVSQIEILRDERYDQNL
jgi:hypothetical protein